jgi:hypothetical protein
MSERFSEEDLAPDSSERRATRTWALDRVAAAAGVTAAGLILGGMLALGAAAAPAVFALTPRPSSGYAMGLAFTRFGQIALGAACAGLLIEVARALLHRRAPQRPWDRVRRLVAIGLAGCAATMAFNLTPEIRRLHESGAVRGEGEQGMLLEATHRRAELVGKLESGLALGLIFLHVLTLRGRTEEEEVSAPLPPGPRG